MLLKYNPEYTCLLVGAKWLLDNGGYEAPGGNGRTPSWTGIVCGHDPYQYPDNLPIVAAKGGPGGKPGCGSLPDVSKNFPVRQLVTNTGWGTGLDYPTQPRHRSSLLGQLLPVTRAVPEPPSIRQCFPGRRSGRSRIPGRRRTAHRCTGPAARRCGPGCRQRAARTRAPAQPAAEDGQTPP